MSTPEFPCKSSERSEPRTMLFRSRIISSLHRIRQGICNIVREKYFSEDLQKSRRKDVLSSILWSHAWITGWQEYSSLHSCVHSKFCVHFSLEQSVNSTSKSKPIKTPFKEMTVTLQHRKRKSSKVNYSISIKLNVKV